MSILDQAMRDIARTDTSVARIDAQVVADIWPAIQPIGDPPDMPLEMLPAGAMREWVTTLAGQYSSQICAVSAMSVLGLLGLIGSRAGVRPYHAQQIVFFPNAWGGLVGDPGSQKSAVIDAALAPIREIDRRVIDDRKAQRAHRAAEIARIEAAEVKAKKAGNFGELEELFLARERAEQPGRYLLIQDATMEALAEIQRANPGGVVLVRDELAGMLRAADRDGQQGAREYLLECWQGGRSYSQHRIKRGAIEIASATLSIIGGIQPAKLASYVQECTSPDSEKNDGLIQRLQVVVVPGERRWEFKDTSSEQHPGVWSMVERMDQWLPLPDPNERVPWQPRIIQLSGGGYGWWAKWIEGWMRGTVARESNPALKGHWSKYRSLMLGIALVFAIVRRNGGAPREIDTPDLRMAAEWCEYLSLHARRMYGLAGRGGPAERLAAGIAGGKIRDRTTVREIQRSDALGRPRLTAADLRAGLADLEESGWVRVGEGGEVRINPAGAGRGGE